jgi:hypothetical protein
MFKWGVAKQLVPSEVYQALQSLSGLKKGKCEAREVNPIFPVGDAIVDATLKHCIEPATKHFQHRRAPTGRP